MPLPYRRCAVSLALALGLGGCRAAPEAPVPPTPVACVAGQTAQLRDALYFGLTIPGGGEIPIADWDDFLANTITPLFPTGLTAFTATGQWREASGLVRSEPSRVVILIHDLSSTANESIRQIIARYRERFHQDAVMWERTQACISF
ncbi:MAG TPA: DUF3574 domain-containing protein [Gemmatimonadales bacterium]|nr:DUF3574 domain-containing protein [Gemmatimonadales bacterium]